MPVPKRKRSRARRDKRFANKGLEVKAIMTCKTCSVPVLPHQVCHDCGHYKGIKVLKTKADRLVERTARRQARTNTQKTGRAQQASQK